VKEIPSKKDDMLEIYEDNGKYILKYPTFNITLPEVSKVIPKEAVDSYLAGEHNGEELIIPSVEVKKVFDSYIFITENNNTLIGKQWVQINDLNRTEYNITNNGSTVKRKLF